MEVVEEGGAHKAESGKQEAVGRWQVESGKWKVFTAR
jgi:hypothetical protein